MRAATLVVELFTEELPPKALKQLGEAFARMLTDELRSREFLSDDSKTETFSTPRRLVNTPRTLSRQLRGTRRTR